MRLFLDMKYDFVGKRRLTLLACGAILAFAIIPGLIFQVTRGSWFNWGVDFTGGTLVQARFSKPVSAGDLRAIVDPVAPNTEIIGFGGQNEFLMRAPRFVDAAGSGSTGTVANSINDVLRARFGADGYEIVRTEAVGPKVGDELKVRALVAVILSFAATLIYLAFRLEWAFGVAAIVATINDILFTIGLLAAFRLEVSLTTVAAILTIIGYSLNDKIVIFDRIRENMKGPGKREPFTNLVNRSINETFPRTVMTGGSVLAVLLVLFLLGGVAIRDFALLMFLGVVMGTLSSMFVAPLILLDIAKRSPASVEKTRSTRAARPAGARV